VVNKDFHKLTVIVVITKVELKLECCICTGGRDEHSSYFVTMADGQGLHY